MSELVKGRASRPKTLLQIWQCCQKQGLLCVPLASNPEKDPAATDMEDAPAPAR